MKGIITIYWEIKGEDHINVAIETDVNFRRLCQYYRKEIVKLAKEIMKNLTKIVRPER